MRRDLGIQWHDIQRDKLLHATYEGIEVLEHRRRIRNVRVRASMEQAGLRVHVDEGDRPLQGALGAEFLPDESGQLLLLVSVTDDAFPGVGDEVYHGLPRPLAESALDGALVVPEIEQLGAGVLLFDRAEVHPTLSSPVLFQWLAGAVVRLLAADDNVDEVELAELLRVSHRGLDSLEPQSGPDLEPRDKEYVRHRDVEAALDWVRKEEAQAAVDVANLVDELSRMDDESAPPKPAGERPKALDRSLNSLTRQDVESAVAWVAREEAQAADDIARLVEEIWDLDADTSPPAEAPSDTGIETWDEATGHGKSSSATPQAAPDNQYQIETVDDVLQRLGLANRTPEAPEPDPSGLEPEAASPPDASPSSDAGPVGESLPEEPAAGEPEEAPLSMTDDPWGEVDLDLEEEAVSDEEQIDDLLALFAAADARDGIEPDESDAPELEPVSEEPPPPEPIQSESGVLIAPSDDLAVFNTGVFDDLMQIVSSFRSDEMNDLPSVEDVMGDPARFEVALSEPAASEPVAADEPPLLEPADAVPPPSELEAGDAPLPETADVEQPLPELMAEDEPPFPEPAEADQPLLELETEGQPLPETTGDEQPLPEPADDDLAPRSGPADEPLHVDRTEQFRRREVQEQLANVPGRLDAEPLSAGEQQVVRHKLGQPGDAADPAPPTLPDVRLDSDRTPGSGEPSTPIMEEQEPWLVFGDDMTEPPITPKMLEDLQRLQEKVEREETEIFVSREGEDVPAEYSDPFGYPPPMKAKRTPFGDLVFYQCAACGEYGAMKVAIHTYRCYRCEAVIEYRPQRVS